jgi:hypothetical protein
MFVKPYHRKTYKLDVLVNKIIFIWSPVKICKNTTLDHVLFPINRHACFLPISNIIVPAACAMDSTLNHCHAFFSIIAICRTLNNNASYSIVWPLPDACAMDSTLTCGLHSVLAWLLVVCSICGCFHAHPKTTVECVWDPSRESEITYEDYRLTFMKFIFLIIEFRGLI